jgi:hypothetical protein
MIFYYPNPQEVEAQPRTYRATFAIYDRALDRMGTVETALEIPELGEQGPAQLLTTSIGMLVHTDKAMVVPFTIANDDGTLFKIEHFTNTFRCF